MSNLDESDQRHLNAANGWLGLGDWQSANDELDEIAAALRALPAVLDVRCRIFTAARKWEGVVAIAETLIEMEPGEMRHWISQSFALRELKRTQEAFDCLAPELRRFPREWLPRYNCAGYLTQLGRLEEARTALETAFIFGNAQEGQTYGLE